MTNCTFAEINSALRENERFAVLGHVRPDGDALGSQLALALSLKQLGKDVRVWNEDGMLEKYSFLPRAELLTKPPAGPEDVDVAIALDTAIQNRLGTALEAIGSAKIWINIDHHPSNPGYGDLVYIDSTAPATGQILFELIKSERLPIDHGPLRSRRSLSGWESMLDRSVSRFTKTFRAGGLNCCANCCALCALKVKAGSPALA